MRFETVNDLVCSMAGMRYFPSEPAARLALVELMRDLTDDEEKVRWLVKRMRTLYAEWPGEREMRAAFCSKYKPKDGINAYSSVYQEGIPSERQQSQPQIAGPEVRALPPAREVLDPQLVDKVKRITPQQARPKSQAAPKVVDQADIERAVREHRAASHPHGTESGSAASQE